MAAELSADLSFFSSLLWLMMALDPQAWKENSQTLAMGPFDLLLGVQRRWPPPKSTRTSSPHFCHSFIRSRLHFTRTPHSDHHTQPLSLLSDVCYSALTSARVWPEGGTGVERGGDVMELVVTLALRLSCVRSSGKNNPCCTLLPNQC